MGFKEKSRPSRTKQPGMEGDGGNGVKVVTSLTGQHQAFSQDTEATICECK